MPSDRARPLRAEDYYTPPPGRPADAWQHLPPAERVVAWYEERMQRRLPRTDARLLTGQPRYARIDAGRWVADCPCGSAQIVSPEDPRLYCVECLPGGWVEVAFPGDIAAAEQEVAEQPRHAQFWWHPDDTEAWNRPARGRRPLTPKEIRAQEEKEIPSAADHAPHVGRR